MPKKRAGTTFYSVSEAAKLLDVHRNTIHYWIEQGMIEYARLGAAPQSPYYIPQKEIDRILETTPAEK